MRCGGGGGRGGSGGGEFFLIGFSWSEGASRGGLVAMKRE